MAARTRFRASLLLVCALSHRAERTPPRQYPALNASSTIPSMTPVSVILEPTTGIARRIAITSTASVEKPSRNAMIQGAYTLPLLLDSRRACRATARSLPDERLQLYLGNQNQELHGIRFGIHGEVF